MHRIQFLIGSLIAWAGSLGLFTLVRRVGARETIHWATDDLRLFILWVFASLLFGTVFWLTTLATETKYFRALPFWILILVKSVAVLATSLLVLGMRASLAVFNGDMKMEEAWKNTFSLLFHAEMGVFLLYLAITSIVLGFVKQMSSMVGRRVLLNLILGKFHRPRLENRIFMFLDMEGSTAIAERLGNQMFGQLIQESFRDLTDSAIRYGVEIYKYVGDEAILTWKSKGGLRDARCLRLFFEFDKTLENRKDFYEKHFGVRPKFKAGANLGTVMVAEIGVLKREIAYMSDVLNTAARLESICHKHEARLLITEALYEALPETEGFQSRLIDELQIRGKNEKIKVYRVERYNED